MRHNTAIYLIEPNLVPVLDRVRFLTPTNNVRVRLENAQYLVLGWHLLILQNSAFGLIHHFLGQWNEGCQRSFQAMGCFFQSVVLTIHWFGQPVGSFSRSCPTIPGTAVCSFLGFIGPLTFRISPIFRADRRAAVVKSTTPSVTPSFTICNTFLALPIVLANTRTLSANSQGFVTRRMNMGLNHSAIGTQLLPFRHFAFQRLFGDPSIEFLQRFPAGSDSPTGSMSLSSGTRFRYTRQNCLNTRLSLTYRSVSA